jgi:hypothetical protein
MNNMINLLDKDYKKVVNSYCKIPNTLYPVIISKEEYKLIRDKSLFNKDGELSINYKIYDNS